MMKAIAETTEFKRIEVAVQDMAGTVDVPASCCRLMRD